ncbi:MAG: Holliday junction resolvase RuvX [Candidatus Paceibacterota bacterium]
MTRFLGIDFGTKRVGIATSDEGGTLAFPKEILKNDSNLLENIKKICQKEEIGEIVIGESENGNGEQNKIMESIISFRELLENETNLPIVFEKEFMTSVEARGRDGKERNNAKKIKKINDKKTLLRQGYAGQEVDDLAAAIILQRYLDKNKFK